MIANRLSSNAKAAFLLLCIVLIHSSNSFGQKIIITQQPNASQGKDALIHEYFATTNLGLSDMLMANAWTFGGTPGKVRSLIQFSYNALPASAVIDSVVLSLHAWDSADGSEQHSTLDGSNACWLERVTSPWSDATVTWNTQPTTTTLNRVQIPASTSPTQNYLNINVTALVKDMLSSTNNGFMLKLQTESYYRRMTFCSSNHSNSNLRPLLVFYLNGTPSASYAKPNFLLINHVYATPGNKALINITLNNKEAVQSAEFELQLPAGITLDATNIIPSARLANHKLTVSNTGINRYKVSISSATHAVIANNSGLLCSIPLHVDAAVPVADVLVNTENCQLLNASSANVNTQNAGFYIIMTKGNCCQ